MEAAADPPGVVGFRVAERPVGHLRRCVRAPVVVERRDGHEVLVVAPGGRIMRAPLGRGAPAVVGQQPLQARQRPRRFPVEVGRDAELVDLSGPRVDRHVEPAVVSLHGNEEATERAHRFVVRRVVRRFAPVRESREHQRRAAEIRDAVLVERLPPVARNETVRHPPEPAVTGVEEALVARLERGLVQRHRHARVAHAVVTAEVAPVARDLVAVLAVGELVRDQPLRARNGGGARLGRRHRSTFLGRGRRDARRDQHERAHEEQCEQAAGRHRSESVPQTTITTSFQRIRRRSAVSVTQATQRGGR